MQQLLAHSTIGTECDYTLGQQQRPNLGLASFTRIGEGSSWDQTSLFNRELQTLICVLDERD